MKKAKQMELFRSTEQQPFKTQYNSIPDQGEVNDDPSMTVPDQSMGLREIVKRYAQGLGASGSKDVYYDIDDQDEDNYEFIPELKNMDLAEREEYIRMVREELDETQQRINKAREDRKKKFREKGSPEDIKYEEVDDKDIEADDKGKDVNSDEKSKK